MKLGKVFITDYISNPDIEKSILGEDLAFEPHENIEVLLVWHEKINADYCKAFPKLKGVVRYGVGFDSLDIPFLKSKSIYASNTPDYGTDEVSDTALAMILSIARGVHRYDVAARQFVGKSWQENTISTLKRNQDLTVGIYGAGRIGGSVVLKCNAMKFRTVIYDKYKERGYEKLLNTTRVDDPNELLSQSDILSIHVPLTEETEGMVNASFVSKMKPGASFVNTARGRIVQDLDVLYRGLSSNHLNAVALDVLPEEPPLPCAFISAWRSRDNQFDGRIIINPHTAYYSQAAYREMREKAALNAKRILNGLPPFNHLY